MSWLKQKLVGVKHGFFEAFKAHIPKLERPDWTQFDFLSYCKRFDEYASKYPKVKSSLISIAGKVAGEGLFLVEAGDYPRAIEAKDYCEKFNDRVGMYLKVRQCAYRMAKYGTAFWEKDWNDVNGLNVQAIPRQRYMTPRFDEGSGEVAEWQYLVYGSPLYRWEVDKIAVFALDPEENPPFGISLLTGIDYELATQEEIRKNLLKYLERQAWASNVLQVGSDAHALTDAEYQQIKTEVKNADVGENFVTDHDIEVKVMGAAQVETRMIPETLRFSDDQITDSLMIAPISKLYNSTEASATKLADEENMRIIFPMQKIISEVLTKQIYQPLLEDAGFSVNVVPKVSFEPPDVYTLEDATYWKTLVDAKVVTPEQAAKELGIEYDSAFFKAEEQKQLDLMKQKTQQAQQSTQGNNPNQPPPKAGETWKVTKLKDEEEHKYE